MIRFDPTQPLAEEASPPADRRLAGQPHARLRTDYESPDGRFSTGEWHCTPGRWRVAYDETEYCRILAGRGAVIDAAGGVHPLVAGDEFVIPAGFTGEWLVEEAMTKRWVVMLP